MSDHASLWHDHSYPEPETCLEDFFGSSLAAERLAGGGMTANEAPLSLPESCFIMSGALVAPVR